MRFLVCEVIVNSCSPANGGRENEREGKEKGERERETENRVREKEIVLFGFRPTHPADATSCTALAIASKCTSKTRRALEEKMEKEKKKEHPRGRRRRMHAPQHINRRQTPRLSSFCTFSLFDLTPWFLNETTHIRLTFIDLRCHCPDIPLYILTFLPLHQFSSHFPFSFFSSFFRRSATSSRAFSISSSVGPST